MVYIKGVSLDGRQSKKSGPVHTSEGGDKGREGTKILHCLPVSSVPDVAAAPFKSPRTSMLIDMETIRGIAYDGVVQNQGEGTNNTTDPEKLSDSNERFLHLNRPLLVRLKLLRHAGEMVRAVCNSRDIRRKGLKLSLPGKFDLRSGSILDLEVFLNHGEDPVTVRGEIRKVARCHSEDLTRYEVDVDFDPMNRTALSRIDGFMKVSETQDYQHLPA